MLIKVCGMASPKQVAALEDNIDFVGFIFFEKSKRFVHRTPRVDSAHKVGVFVDAALEEIRAKVSEHALDFVQLHGQESPEFCAQIKPETKIIKAFGVDHQFSFASTEKFENCVDFFLFDTKTPQHGGSGTSFDWSILANYHGSTPFLLSGGIRLSSIDSIKQFRHPQFAGIDLNSGFEFSPADKNVVELNQFIQLLKH